MWVIGVAARLGTTVLDAFPGRQHAAPPHSPDLGFSINQST